jgi:hypothetical protein
MKFRFLPLALFILSGFGLAHAAPSGLQPVGLYFRTIGVDVDATDLGYVEGTKLIPVTVDSQRRSSFYQAKPTETSVTFARSNTLADGTKVKEPVATVTINPGMTRVLLIFHKLPGDSSKFGIVVLSDDSNAVPPGGYRVVNFLPIPAGVVIGDKKQIIAPQAAYIAAAPATGANQVYESRVFAITNSQTAIPVYSNVLAPDLKRRALILIVPSVEAPSGVEVKFLSESVDLIPAEEPSGKPQT